MIATRARFMLLIAALAGGLALPAQALPPPQAGQLLNVGADAVVAVRLDAVRRDGPSWTIWATVDEVFRAPLRRGDVIQISGFGGDRAPQVGARLVVALERRGAWWSLPSQDPAFPDSPALRAALRRG